MSTPDDLIHRATCATTLLVGMAGCGLALATFLVELPKSLMAVIGITVFVPPWGGVVLVAPVLFVVCAVLMIQGSAAAVGLTALTASCAALAAIPFALIVPLPVMWAYVVTDVLVAVLAFWSHARSNRGRQCGEGSQPP